MVAKRISNLSSNKQEFEKAFPPYQKALNQSGYKNKQEYIPEHCYDNNNEKKSTRKRNITWFNPPYSANVATKIGKQFFKLLDKHFPPHHKLYKICNKNTIKLSYSCMPSFKNIIFKHNQKLLDKDREKQTKPECNCRKETNCPLNGKCLMKSIVYKATVTTKSRKMQYFGSCETDFKTRYRNHTHSFKNIKLKNVTTLSKEVWKLKENNQEFHITWDIVKHAATYRCGGLRCNLCLEEKLAILLSDPNMTLNRRSELISRCRHRNKFKLRSIK